MNKPQPHAEIIKAWADGAQIQCKNEQSDWWDIPDNDPSWNPHYEYRIKPEPKPDSIHFARFTNLDNGSTAFAWCFDANENCNIRITFDGETRELKSAEIIG